MLEWFLFALGIFFMLLGVTKKTGFQGHDWNQHLSTGFFVFGFFMILSAVFLFNATIPYGVVNEVNTTKTDNVTAAIYDDLGNYMGTIYFKFPTTEETRSYQTNAGPDIANLVFYVMAVIGTVYAILWAIMLMKKAFENKKHSTENENG